MLGVGPAVRLVFYVQQTPKYYRATFRLGQSSVSGDLEGDQTAHPSPYVPTLEEINVATEGMVGRIEQTPPAHSAIWVDGQRAYKRIRAGEEFEMPTRMVDIHSLKTLRYEYPEVDLDIACGSGTYVRTIGIDLAASVQTHAVMSFLCRNGVGPFTLEQSVSIEQLRDEQIESMLLPAEMGVAHLPRIEIDADDSIRLGHGKCITCEALDPSTELTDDTEAIAVTSCGLRAIVRWKRDAWYPHRVFPVDSI